MNEPSPGEVIARIGAFSTMSEAAVIVEIAASLLDLASQRIRDTEQGPVNEKHGSRKRAINYQLCHTKGEADRLAGWIRDQLGPQEFCQHGTAPHIVKAHLCDRCEKGLP